MINITTTLLKIGLIVSLIGVLIIPLSSYAAAEAEYVPNEVIVQVKRNSRPVTGYQLERFGASDVNPTSEYLILRIDDGASVPAVIKKVERLPGVISAERNYYSTITTTQPNDPLFSTQWHHNATAGVKTAEAWDTQRGSSNIIIAVIDIGVELAHPDLANNIWKNSAEISANGSDDDHNGFIDDLYGWDYVDDDNDPNPVASGSYSSHGTHVAGTAAGVGNNAVGISGISWNATIMPIRVFNTGGSGSNTDIAAGIIYAVDHKADVLNLSFAGTGSTSILADAISYAVSHNVIVVAAMGNETKNVNTLPYYPACYSGVIGVTATNSDATAATYSNYGSNCADIAAPGSSIYATVFTKDPVYKYSSYGYMSGTSMATPIVAGQAALLLAQDDSLSATAVTNIIKTTAANISLSSNYGTGLADADLALAAVPCVQSDQSVDRPQLYYGDSDGDTLGDPANSAYLCPVPTPSGYVTNANDTNDQDADNDGVTTLNDCNDRDATLTITATYYQDSDGDSLGNGAQPTDVCSTTPPTGYVSNYDDLNDADYDNDWVQTSADCDDHNIAMGGMSRYYQDNDGDHLGNGAQPTDVCSTTPPTGYVSNYDDLNDADYDNDWVQTSADCDDADNTVSATVTYYRDADNDGLGAAHHPASVCALVAPAGYVSNAKDTNDKIANAGIEIKGDHIDNDGDSAIDEVNTIERNGLHPTFKQYDMTNKTLYQRGVKRIVGTSHGKIQITYRDQSVYAYTIFNTTSDQPTQLQRYQSSNYLIIIQPDGNQVALVNVFTGHIFVTKTFSTHKAPIQLIRRKSHILIRSQRYPKIRLLIKVDVPTASLFLTHQP